MSRSLVMSVLNKDMPSVSVPISDSIFSVANEEVKGEVLRRGFGNFGRKEEGRDFVYGKFLCGRIEGLGLEVAVGAEL